MDEARSLSRASTLRFGPDRRLTVATTAAAVVCAVLAAVTADPAGRLMLVGVVVLLSGYAVGDLVFRPRITAGADGLVLNSPFARARLNWADIDAIRADSRQRLGLRSSTLEIDAGTLVAVFTKRALATDPFHAAALLNALDPRNAGSAHPGSAHPGSEGDGSDHDDGQDQASHSG